MDSKIKILLGILVLGILVVGGWQFWNSIFLEKEPSIPPEWKICTSDSDCVETRGGCCPCSMGGTQTAINKKYLEKWMEKLEKFCPLAPCPAEYKCEEGIVVCKDNRCEFLSAGPRGKPAVFLFTDKKNYRKGEEIKVTIISGIGIPIYYRDWSKSQNECKGTSFRLGKRGERYTWNFSEIGGAECSNPVVKLDPHSEVTYSLDPNESEKLEEGTYQWEFTFGLKKDLKKTFKVFSNEFTISSRKEKVTITTDKTEYTKGETIKIILRNNLDRPIWYYDWSEFGCVGGFSIGKKEERYKEFYPLATEKCLRPIAKLEPKSEKVYKLNLSLFTPAREHWEKYNVKLLGTFKLKFNYFLNEISAREYHINKAITIYSNEFTIK